MGEREWRWGQSQANLSRDGFGQVPASVVGHGLRRLGHKTDPGSAQDGWTLTKPTRSIYGLRLGLAPPRPDHLAHQPDRGVTRRLGPERCAAVARRHRERGRDGGAVGQFQLGVQLRLHVRALFK